MEALLNEERSDDEVAAALADALGPTQVAHVAPSIGIPVLMPDGHTLLRGPRINVPEVLGRKTSVRLGHGRMETWVRKGWVDLRPVNVRRWRERVGQMVQARTDLRLAGSAAATTSSYMSETFEIGEVVAWIFNNELKGHRVK